MKKLSSSLTEISKNSGQEDIYWIFNYYKAIYIVQSQGANKLIIKNDFKNYIMFYYKIFISKLPKIFYSNYIF